MSPVRGATARSRRPDAAPSAGGRAGIVLTLLLVVSTACGDGGAVEETSGSPQSLDFAGKGLLLISLDTLRADRLGCYGYDRETSPFLDELAAESVLFESVYATSPKTASSHMSLFTSMLPTAHGVTNVSNRYGIKLKALAPNRLTLGQVLNQADYWNAAVACGGNVQPKMGFTRGFKQRFISQLMPIEDTVDRALELARHGVTRGKPPFLFVHTYEIHAPYLPPATFRERLAPTPGPVLGPIIEDLAGRPRRELGLAPQGLWDQQDDFTPADVAYLSDLYDAGIAHTDQELRRFFGELEQLGVLDDWIVVVLSDHGEEFAEHGDFEHDQLYTEHLHVPLIVRLPGGELGGTRVTGQASLLDVMPTLLELLDLPGPETMQGRSLVPAMRSGRTEDLPVLAEHVMFPGLYRATLRAGGQAITYHQDDCALSAFDLGADPDEQSDLGQDAAFFASASGTLRARLTQLFQLREALDGVAMGEELPLDEEQLSELLQLGYTGDDLPAPEGSPLSCWPEEGDGR